MDLMIQAAKEAEVAVVVVGNHPICGDKLGIQMFNTDTSTKPCADKSEGREGRDRESIDLSQEDLIRKVYAVNPRTIVVLVSSFPYAIQWTQATVPAILQSAHSSQDEGTAIADVLFGDYNPGGRLNQTWPKSLSQIPPMDDYDIRHGRTYMYFKGEPLYPFGYGLSYTTFQYSTLKSSVASLSSEGTATISVDIKNTGTRAGDEVVQLYVSHLPAAAGRPAQELKGFERVTLKPGEQRTVTIPLKSATLAWWNDTTKKFEVDPGPLEVRVGSSSADIRQKKTITIKP
jgi:beta-glucosidase